VEVKRLIFSTILVALIVILAESAASAVSENDTSPTYADMSTGEIATNQTQASNAPASATVTITICAVAH